MVEAGQDKLSAFKEVVVDYRKKLRSDLQKLKDEFELKLEEMKEEDEQIYKESKEYLQKVYQEEQNNLQSKLGVIVDNIKKITEGIHQLDMVFESSFNLSFFLHG